VVKSGKISDNTHMLIGRYYHALEQKGRLSIPSSMRNELGETAIVTSGLDGCLFVYADNEWRDLIARSQHLSSYPKSCP
jgi:MraZ protein